MVGKYWYEQPHSSIIFGVKKAKPSLDGLAQADWDFPKSLH